MFHTVNLNTEAHIRDKILRIYNKPRSMFSSQREYDDYLEEIEDISKFTIIHFHSISNKVIGKKVYSLVNKENLEDTEKKKQEYEESNQALIIDLNIKKTKEFEQVWLLDIVFGKHVILYFLRKKNLLLQKKKIFIKD